MQKYIYMMIMWLCSLSVFAQTEGFNPPNPPDPNKDGTGSTTYSLKAISKPYGAVSTYVWNERPAAGESGMVRCYDSSSFKFKRWVDDKGDVVSTETIFYYEMPARDVVLIAEFDFIPTSPSDPGNVDGNYSTISFAAKPANAGDISMGDNEKLPVGSNVGVWTSPRGGFKFSHWEDEKGNVVSINTYFEFVVPDKDAKYYAIYEYSPDTPEDPGNNEWDETTGTLIVDRFKSGYLWSSIDKACKGDYSKVYQLIVGGQIQQDEVSVANNLPNLVNFDLSRVTGITEVGSWILNNNQVLERIELPATVNSIGSYAFNGCSSLNTIVCHSLIPPTVNYSAFEGLPETVTVYVPESSITLYEEAEDWKAYGFQFLPIAKNLSLEITLPSEAEDGRYKNMSLELLNTVNGQKYKYLVTDRISYIFSNLPRNTKYSAYLKNQMGDVIGQIDDISLEDNDISLKFSELKAICHVTFKVLDPQDNDCTSDVTINWYSSNGTFLGTGNSVGGMVEGSTIKYTVTLPESLAMNYIQPEEGEITFSTPVNSIICTLSELPRTTVQGFVKDLQSGGGIPGVIVTCSQTVNGKYPKTVMARTDGNGRYSVELYKADASITFSTDEYVSQTVELKEQDLAPEMLTMEDVNLKQITGTTVNLSFTYTESVPSGETSEAKSGYDDYNNVSYNIYNVTKKKNISQYSVQYPKIVLLEEVGIGDELEFTVTSRKNSFMPITAKGKVSDKDMVDVTLPVVQLGGISASYLKTDNLSVVSILYDANGVMQGKATYEGGAVSFSDLADGTYTLVSMGESSFFNNIYSIAGFDEAGLVEGVDYSKKTVAVESGVIATVKTAVIPFFDEKKLYYTGNNTSFSVNKSLVVAGSYLTFTGLVDFKSTFAGQVSDLRLIVDMPEGISFVNNSTMLGSSLFKGYTYSDGRLSVPMDAANPQRVRFCAVPANAGKFSPNAFISFKIGDKEIQQPIGSAQFEVTSLTFVVPEAIGKAKFVASGAAPAKSTVEIYDGRILVGKTTALANGLWRAACELFEPADSSVHNIFAKVYTKDGVEMLSETKQLLFDKSVVEVNSVQMINTAHGASSLSLIEYKTLFDFQNPSMKQKTYWYWPDYPRFTFLIDLTNNEVGCVLLNVYLSDNRFVRLNTVYNKKLDRWVAYGNFNSNSLPINVSVSINCGQPTPTVDGDATYVLDPSGFVYEGVESNRLEGVKATVFYKEFEEDMYGDLHEKVVLWNAEDYAQENPLFTDENGMYAWDVPEGLWQVKFEKEGYQTAYSEWLPVPPPQLEVNVPMVQNAIPEVVSSKAYQDENGKYMIELEFSKYMRPETLGKNNVYLQVVNDGNESVVDDLNIELANEEQVSEDNSTTYCSKIILTTGRDLGSEGEVHVIVSNAVESYAGIAMSNGYDQKLDIEKKLTVNVSETLNVGYGKSESVQISVTPADGSKGKTLVVRPLSGTIASVEGAADNGEREIPLDENGMATVEVNGELIGSTSLSFSVKGSDANAQTIVNVVEQAELDPVKVVMASRPSGEIYRGQKVALTCETTGAAIYYTVDGSEPTSNSTKYEGLPISIDGNTTLKTIAIGLGGTSQVKSYTYSIKKVNTSLALSEGWTWASHALSAGMDANDLKQDYVERILTQTQELFNDPKLGFVGGIDNVSAVSAMKIKAKSASSLPIAGEQLNPASCSFDLEQGWNWLGYPLTQTMKLDEALSYLDVEEGDYITNLSGGYAEYNNGAWVGDLQTMEPGKGYLYKSVSSKSFVYNNTIVSKAKALYAKRLALDVAPWSVDVHKYPNMMCVTAELFNGESVVDGDNYYLGAFVGEECRGVAKYINGKYFLSVYGDKKATVNFVAVDKETGESYTVEQTVDFTADVLGSVSSPYAIYIVSPTGINGITADSPSAKGIYNMMGQKVKSASRGGVYVIDGRKRVVTKRNEQEYMK